MASRKAFLLRVDKALYDELERWAADELRSVNSQIEYALRDALLRAGRRSPPRHQGNDESRGGESPR